MEYSMRQALYGCHANNYVARKERSFLPQLINMLPVKLQPKALSTPATMSMMQHCRMLQVERFFRQHYNTECCFDKVERCFDIVAGVNGALCRAVVKDALYNGIKKILRY